ncbi:MAG: branched-chain amino acid ABC transporter permease [Gemmatimonadota bacterium]
MDFFLQLFVSGLALGAIYALVALGFVVIYRASQVFNFAQGELLAVGAFVMVALSRSGLPWGVAFVATLLITGLVSLAIERGILRRFVARSILASIIVTIFLAAVIRIGLIVIWGTDPRGMPTPWTSTATVQLGGASVLVNSLAAVGAAAAALAAFFLILKHTRIGVAMRATSSDQEASLSLGIPVGRVFAAAWFIAGVYAAVGGVFLGMFPRTVDPNIGLIALAAFPAVIVGGLESPAGVVIAGVALGVIEVLAGGYVNPLLGQFGQNFHTVLPYLIMILFLVFRPYGLFGQPEVRRA